MQNPIDETYAAVYRDRHGEEQTTLHNDGRRLTITVGGVTFDGMDFVSLEAAPDTVPTLLTAFCW